MNQENKQLPTAYQICQSYSLVDRYGKADQTAITALEEYKDLHTAPLREELEKLRAENKKLKSDTDRRIKGYNDLHDDLIGYRDKYDQSVQDMEELKEENQKLREALESIISLGDDAWGDDIESLYVNSVEIAKEALKGGSDE